jgi:hypothetical protein
MGFTEDAYRGVGEGEHLEQMTHAGNPLTPIWTAPNRDIASSYAMERGAFTGTSPAVGTLKVRPGKVASDADVERIAVKLGFPPDNPVNYYIDPLASGDDANKVLQGLRDEGFDSVRFLDWDAADERKTFDALAVLDPKNIRSRFAKFDPAKADSSDLLAYQPKVLERDATGRPIKREPFPRGAADRTVAEIEKRLPAGLLDLPTDEASRMARGYSGEANTTLAISRQMPDDQATKLIKSRIGQITRDAKLRGAPPSGPYAIEIGALRNRLREIKDLPTDEASRMARAREFDTDVYHGSGADIQEFKPSDRGLLGPGVYVAKRPEAASKWAPDNFDPKNIRSRFAKFDPAKAGSADILAGLGVVGAGAALSQQDGFDYGALSNVVEGSNGQRSN